MDKLNASFYCKNKLIKTSIIEKIETLENIIYSKIKKNIFVFISKKMYNSLNPEITKEIDNISFPDDISNNKSKSLEEILSMKVVFVKYNLEYEIEEVTKLRSHYDNKNYFVILSEVA